MAQDAKIVAIPDGSNGDATVMTVASEHRFRELLTILMGCLEPLQRQPLDDKGQRQLGVAVHAVGQLRDLFLRKEH